MRKIITGGIAVTLGVATALAGSAFAGSSAGQPTDSSVTLCGTGNAPTTTPDGASSESKFGGAMFTASQESAGTQCTNDNSGTSDGTTWTILHGNVNTGTERGTEHGQYMLSGSSRQGGFNGHVTDFDFASGADPCVDAAGRTVYYQSGKATDCTPSFGPVGNFNTHGGAQTGDHFRGNYGTIIFQQNSNTSHACDVGSQTYCIQVDLVGQTN